MALRPLACVLMWAAAGADSPAPALRGQAVEPARNLTAEEAMVEQTLSARAKVLSAWWAAQNATTRLTRTWSGPMVKQSAEASLPALEETTDLWHVHGHGPGHWHGGGGPGFGGPGFGGPGFGG